MLRERYSSVFASPYACLQQRFVLERVGVARPRPMYALRMPWPCGKLIVCTRIPLLEARREGREVVVVERRRAFLGLEALLDPAGRDAGRLVRHRRMERVELVLHEELPVRVLHDAVADRHDLDLAERRAVAHVVEGDLGLAEELGERRSFVDEAREDEAAVAVDAGGALHAAVGVVAGHPRALVALGERDRAHAAVEVEAPGVVRADEGAAGVALEVADDLHAAVRAAVVEHLHAHVGLADHDHRLAPDRHRVVVAGVRAPATRGRSRPRCAPRCAPSRGRRSAGRCRPSCGHGRVRRVR